MGLLFGRLAGLLLAAAGLFAGLTLYTEFNVWTEPTYVRIAMLVPTGGAVAFALIQGTRMSLARTTAALGFPVGIRVFAVAIIMALVLLGFLFKLPDAVARGPIAAFTVDLQAAIVLAGLVQLLRGGARRRRDGA